MLFRHASGTLWPVPSHDLVDLSYPDETGTYTVWATIKNWPGWSVELEVRTPASGGAVASQLRVYPSRGDGSPPPRLTLPEMPTVADVRRAADQSRWSTDSADLPPGGIPARAIKAINVGELLDLAQREAKRRGAQTMGAAEVFRDKDPELTAYLRRAGRADAKLGGRRQRPGRAGLGVDHYLLWTVRYLDKCSEPGMRAPVPALSNRFHKTERWIRDTLQDAHRRHGLWKPYGQGRVGGELTQKARDLLAERTKED